MTRIAIKDDRFRIVGYVETERGGKQRALDSRFRIVGYYDPSSDVTKDARFRLFARGNALAALIFSASDGRQHSL